MLDTDKELTSETISTLHSVMLHPTPCCRGSRNQRVRPVSEATQWGTPIHYIYLVSGLP